MTKLFATAGFVLAATAVAFAQPAPPPGAVTNQTTKALPSAAPSGGKMMGSPKPMHSMKPHAMSSMKPHAVSSMKPHAVSSMKPHVSSSKSP